MEIKYILEREEKKPLGLDSRPTQEDIKKRGEGFYTLRAADGKVLKHYRVAPNRNGNLAVSTETPSGLDGVSTLNLNRMIRDYTRVIVKHWPAKAADVRKIDTELSVRSALTKAVGL